MRWGQENRVPPLRPVSVCCRAEVIIAHTISTLFSRREVYCPPSPSALLTKAPHQIRLAVGLEGLKMAVLIYKILWWGGSDPYHGVLVRSEHSNSWHSPRD